MDVSGKLKDVTKDWKTNRFILSFEIYDDISDVDDISECDLSLTIKKLKKKRSLSANAYFHVLVHKIADKVGCSNNYAKNRMICSYGQPDSLEDGSQCVIKTNVPPERMMENDFIHCKPCGSKTENGLELTFYRIYRGSHTYDSREMSVLINGTVEEAKQLGIETMTPAELERMVERWKPSFY